MSATYPVTSAAPPNYATWPKFRPNDAPQTDAFGRTPIVRGGTSPLSQFLECQWPDFETSGGETLAQGTRFLVEVAPQNTVAQVTTAENQAVERWGSLYGTPYAVVRDESVPGGGIATKPPVNPPPPPKVDPPILPPKVLPRKPTPGKAPKLPPRAELVAAGYTPRSRWPVVILGGAIATIIGVGIWRARA